LQICERLRDCRPDAADVLRRALTKQKRKVIEEIHGEFVASAKARGHCAGKDDGVWDSSTGFAGYASARPP